MILASPPDCVGKAAPRRGLDAARGDGLLWGIQIIRDAGIRESNVLRLAPPLVIGEEDVENAVSLLAEALTAVQSRARA